MAALERVKLLVLGDSGVGKSSFVQLLCSGHPLGKASWTVGCSLDVRLHEYKEGTPLEKTFFLEMWDIGGSVGSASSIKSTRSLFYNGVNGIILVHDLTNKKSCQNLRGWLTEVLNRESAPTGMRPERERLADSQTPLLMVGTKLDQVPEAHRSSLLSRVAFFAEDLAANEMILDCTNPRYLAAGSSNAVKLSRFFDKVIERRYFVKETSVMGTERWRASFAYKGRHFD